MKKALIHILLILFLCAAGLYSTEITDANDSTKVRKKKEVYLVAIGGLGFAYGIDAKNIWDYFGKTIYSFAPTLALGVELPFTKSHKFAFELYAHNWFGKLKGTLPEFDVYSKISDKLYSQMGLSAVIKAYIGNVDSKWRFSFHLGYMGFSPDKHYDSMDFGFALYYKIDQNYSFSLNSVNLVGFSEFIGPSYTYAPNLITLNLNYKFKL